MPDHQDRLEREIDEIVRKLDDFPSHAKRIRALKKRQARGPSPAARLLANLTSVSGPQLVLGGIALVFLSYFVVDQAIDGAGQYGIIAGLLMFFAGFLISFRPPGGGRPPVRTWRGRPIDPEPSDLRDRLRAWRRRR